MARMSSYDRKQWMHGTAQDARVIASAVQRGTFHCDECETLAAGCATVPAPAVSISHQGIGSAVRVECATHFLARIRADRLTRPTQAELAARVNLSVQL